MKDIIFITFDISRTDYPAMNYSMASIFATLKTNGFRCSHFPIDIKQSLQDSVAGAEITSIVKSKLTDGIEYFKEFRYIAISVTRWSIEHCNSLIELLYGSNAKIILGGYEITATDNDILLSEYPKVDYFIKGYAEQTLVKLLKGHYEDENKILQESISQGILASPYLTGVLNLYTRKIYWETKRGCRFRCGFCEWGNAEQFLIEIDKTRLFQEIDLIKESSIDEINILDATFNFGRNYLDILQYVLEHTDVKLTFQARFETLASKAGDEFLQLSAQYKERIHMEFGLQTIHQNEMEVIGRKNNIEKVTAGLEKLNTLGINYEVSMIYAIPGQTVESFIDTIEFLLTNNCKKIRAYPLQIPRNSELEKKKNEYQVSFKKDIFNISSIISSYSFNKENREDMDIIAERLNSDELNEIKTLPIASALIKTTPFQYEISSIDEVLDIDYLYNLVDKSFMTNTENDIFKYDYFQSLINIGSKYGNRELYKNKKAFLHKAHKQEFFYHLEKKDSPILPIKIYENGDSIDIRQSQKDMKFYCKIRIGLSGNIYVYREIQQV